MSDWPYRIPFDLYKELESRRADDWQAAMRAWAKSHGLRIKLHWWPSLEGQIADLHSRRYTAGSQDHWAAMRDWLVRNDVPVPNNLRGWPEQE